MGLQGQGINGGLGTLQRYIALVRPHHRAEHLRRQGQEPLLDAALDQLGRLHQVDQLGEQGLGQIDPPAAGPGRRLEGPADRGATFGPIHLHPLRRQGGDIGLGRADRHSIAMEPVAAAQPPTVHRRIAVGEAHRHHGRIEQGHQPAQRSAETQLPLAPAHEATTLQGADPDGDQLAQHLDRGAARHQGGGEHERTARGLPHLQGCGLDPAAAREAQRRLGGHPVAERLLGRRALVLLAAIPLLLRQPLHQHRQTARCPQAAQVAAGQAGGRECVRHQRLQLGQGQADEIGGQLLGTDLQQKGGHGGGRIGLTVCNRGGMDCGFNPLR